MLEAAGDVQVRLPALEALEQVYAAAIEQGFADRDYSAVLQLLEKWAGVEIKASGK